VVALVGSNVPVIEGANGSLESIAPGIEQPGFDGHAAAEFLAARGRDGPFTVLALGKLTNVALALMKEPTLAEKMRVVWLGSNFPLPGEYNLENDPQAARFVLDHAAVFEIVTVRYGEATGTDAVRITLDEIRRRMPGLGPHVSAVEGRHGGSFEHFGDYSLDLFSHAEPNGDPPSRPLFDLAAAAIVAEPGWAGARTIPAPALDGVAWNEVPHQERTITLWEHFERDAIVEGLFTVLSAP
jgi:inosine-uridine nucleoside N-ribohydrolase